MAEEPIPASQSYVAWMYSSLGPALTLLLPLVGLICFVLALLIVIRGRGPLASAALILIVHVPIFLCVLRALEGLMDSYAVLAMSDVTPKPSEVAAGISSALVGPFVGMLITIPLYGVAAIGAFVRSMVAPADNLAASPK